MNTEQTVKNFLGDFFDVSKVKDDDNIFELGLVNSLFAVQLVNFIEQEFDVIIDNDDLDIQNFRSVSAISALINSKLQNQ